MGLEWVHWCRKGRSQVVCYKETKQRMCFHEEGVANCLPGKMTPEARGHCVLERNSFFGGEGTKPKVGVGSEEAVSGM